MNGLGTNPKHERMMMKQRMKHTTQDGINVKNRTVSRGYLKPRELSNLIFHLSTVYIANEDGVQIYDELLEKRLITKEQKKNLKMALTYLRKYAEDVMKNNLDRKTKMQLFNKLTKFEIKVVDDYQIQQVERVFKTANEVQLDRQLFETMMESVHFVNCKGCTKNRCECELQTFFEDYFIPPVLESALNCEYAY